MILGYLQGRRVAPCLAGMVVAIALLCTGLGAIPVRWGPSSDVDVAQPLRIYGAALLSAFPIAVVRSECLDIESSARQHAWLGQIAAPLTVLVIALVGIVAGSSVTGFPVLSMAVSFTFASGIALLTFPVFGVAAWTISLGVALACAFVGAERAWWSTIPPDPGWVHGLAAAAAVVGGCAAIAARASRSSVGAD